MCHTLGCVCQFRYSRCHIARETSICTSTCAVLSPCFSDAGLSQNWAVLYWQTFSAMLHYTPPQPSDMNSSTLSPFSRVKRFSTSQDKHPTPDNEILANPKRSSRLNDFMSRTRTASLPPRPHSSGGPLSRQKLSARLGNLKGKGKEKADSLSPDADSNADGEYVIAAASSSMTSGKHSILHSFHPGPYGLVTAPVRCYAACIRALLSFRQQWSTRSSRGYCYFFLNHARCPARSRFNFHWILKSSCSAVRTLYHPQYEC